jgi:hypothetical protein
MLPSGVISANAAAFLDPTFEIHDVVRQIERLALENTADDATFGANGGAVDGGGVCAGDEGDDSGYFLGCCETLEKRTRPTAGKELFFDLGLGCTLLLGHVLQEAPDAFRCGRTDEDGIHSDACAGNGFGEAAGNGDLRSLCHAVVDHFRRNLLRGFAGDEDDAAPVLFEHAGKVVTRQANAAENVNFEKAKPIGVGNFHERFGLKDAKVVDEDIGVRDLIHEGVNAR